MRFTRRNFKFLRKISDFAHTWALVKQVDEADEASAR